MKNAVLDTWEHAAQVPLSSTILPDGCMDVIAVLRPGATPELCVTPLAMAPSQPSMTPGATMTGYRLRPGWRLTDLDAVRHAFAEDPCVRLEHVIDASVAGSVEPDAALAALSSERSVARACRHLGVSPRSLQRHFAAAGLPAPGLWHGLARARRAGRLLSSAQPLADIAAETGYADQSHMTHAMIRWFGASPKTLRTCPSFAAQISGTGLGDLAS